MRGEYLSMVIAQLVSLVAGGVAKGQCPPLHTFEGGAEHDYLGRAVGPAGDLDGDGYDDILVGIPGYDDPALGHMGRAYVYSGRTGKTLLTLEDEYIEPAGGGPFGMALDGGGRGRG